MIGHKKQWQFLKKSAQRGKIPHALLFSGQNQLGKKSLAIEYAKLLIKSANCGLHPDFILVQSANASDIQISQIRELIWKLSLRPYSSLFKIAVIDEAHKMNWDAQNCFLKILEEPKGKSVLILITEYPEMLSSTILSRVQKIRFFPVKIKEIEDYFTDQGISKDRASYFASISSGKPGRAISFYLDENKIKEREKIISDINKIGSSDLGFRFQYAKNMSQNSFDTKEVLDIWLDYFRNLFISKLNNSEGKYSLVELRNIISLIQSTDYLISNTNINSKLALEALLMEL